MTEMRARYGQGGTPPPTTDVAEFLEPLGCFLVAFMDSEPVGCGGFRRLDEGVAELKRVYVVPALRRQGVATRILAVLEGRARKAGYRLLRLETGTEQPEALALYRTRGYVLIEPYGHYRNDPRSRSFEKSL